MASQTQDCAYFDNMPKIGKKHWHMFWIFSLCYFFDMMDMQIFGSMAASIQATFGLTNDHMSELSSLFFYGCFFGGIFAGIMADKIGRKKALIMNVAIYSIASLGNATIDFYPIFGACRFLTGFGVIGMNITAMVYIAEMMPAHSRGKYQGLMATIGSMGIPFGIILGAMVIPTAPEAWRIMFYLGAVGIILVPIGMKVLYESPRWLVRKGRAVEADRIVTEMSGLPSNLAAQGDAFCDDEKVGMGETVKYLFRKKNLKTTFTLAIISIGCVTGGQYLSNWLVLIPVQMGYDLQIILMFQILGVFGAPLGDFISSRISDKGGRKTPIVVCLFIATGLLVVQGLTLTVIPTPFVALAVFNVIGLLRAAMATCSTTMYWTYLAENLPNKHRSNGTGIIMSFSRLLIAVITPTVPIFMAMGGISPMFNTCLANAVLYFIPAIVCLAWGTRTAKKTLEQIEAETQE